MSTKPKEGAEADLPARVLLNSDGSAFNDLAEIALALEPLTTDSRKKFRNANAAAIAKSNDQRLLIVGGPGTGKTYLFLDRIRHWLAAFPDASIYVASFVRKLVDDLRGDIEREIDKESQKRIRVTTLHTLARSFIERNNGSRDLPLRQHIRVIGRYWDDVVWADTLAFRPDLQSDLFTRSEHDRQLHTETPEASTDWTEIRQWARELCRFFNAVGFAHMITVACEAVDQSPQLIEHKLWILDEYQDFNNAEDTLVRRLTLNATGLLMAGDDEQALYVERKASRPEIVIGHYNDGSYANAMLPFCGRCSYYICRAAASFIEKHRAPHGIAKIYLPLEVDHEAAKVRIVGMAKPITAIDYIDKFLSTHEEEFARYRAKVEDGKESDPFLLILSQNGCLTRTRSSDADRALFDYLEKFGQPPVAMSDDYSIVAIYAVAGWHEDDNFAIRKVLDLEHLTTDDVHGYIVEAMRRVVPLSDVIGRAHPEILNRARTVAGILDTEGLPAAEMATLIGGILPLKDAKALVRDLEGNPIKRSAAREVEDEKAIDVHGPVEPVLLMTIFGAKGLSAHHVMVVGCDDANMNRTRELPFYVAVTRARKSLHLLMALQAGGAKELHPFALDLPEECCEYATYKKTGRVLEILDGKDDLIAQIAKWRDVTERGRRLWELRKRRRS